MDITSYMPEVTITRSQNRYTNDEGKDLFIILLYVSLMYGGAFAQVIHDMLNRYHEKTLGWFLIDVISTIAGIIGFIFVGFWAMAVFGIIVVNKK